MVTTEHESPFRADGSTPVEAPGTTVTLVAGTSFLILDAAGDIWPGASQGYYAGDTRLLSRLSLLVDGDHPVLLRSEAGRDWHRALAMSGDPEAAALLIVRDTRLADDVTVAIELHNLTGATRRASVDLRVAVDFADLFHVKRGERPRGGFVMAGPDDGSLVFAYDRDGFTRQVRLACDREAEFLRDGAHLLLELQPHAVERVVLTVTPEDPAPGSADEAGLRNADRTAWLGTAATVRTSDRQLTDVLDASRRDLASLLLVDPAASDHHVVAAGSPWFMALFGRDSLLTSWQCLPLGVDLALGALHALAARQGRRNDPDTDEQPGRILHEVRSGEVVQRDEGWGAVYYGSVDATPLFVMLLAEAWRWGAPTPEVRDLLPAAERAVEWILGPGDSNGDLFVDYPGAVVEGAGLRNQGWKDSDDAVRHPDGSLARGPIALVEVQGYCDAALRGLADLREAFGTGDPAPLRRAADRLRRAIDEAFWLEDEGTYALAVDGEGRAVRSVATNAGHLLWTGTASGDRARRTAARLTRPDLFTGYGLRTLSAGNPGFNPLSYHCGSVWPHDTAIVAAGMLRSDEEAGREVALGLLRAAVAFEGRLPELFGGFPADRFPRPVPYPTSCAPQAWAAGAPLLLVRALLGLDPDVPGRCLRLAPRLPDDLEVEVAGLRLGDDVVTIRARGRAAEVEGCRFDVVVG